VVSVGRALLKTPIPALDIRQGRTFDVQLKISIERCADRNVGKRQDSTGQEGSLGQDAVKKSEMFGTAPKAPFDCGPVTLLFRRAVVTLENPIEEIRLQGRLRPIHPSVDHRSGGRIVNPESTPTVLRSKITEDRM